jgi:hypothetical protein
MEDEAARFRGYKMGEWQAESLVNKAKCIAHFLYHNKREAYITEKMSGSIKGEENEARYEEMRRRNL